MSTPPSPDLSPYQKPWLSYAEQVALLESRGVTIPNPASAAQFLAHVNYYRFSGYLLAFEQAKHTYRPGLTFDQVRAAYDFDRVLRDLVTEALEIVEVDLKAALAHHFGQRYGAYGHTDSSSFYHRFEHRKWLDKIHDEADRSSEPFVKHVSDHYTRFPDLPIWIATEIMSFGGLSQMYSGLDRADQKPVASRYRFQPGDLRTSLHHLVYIRNLCAHHSRLWDRVWAIKPTLPHGGMWEPPMLPGNDRLFCTLLLLYRLLRHAPSVAPFDRQWRERVTSHLAQPPSVTDPLGCMGLPATWKQHPLWR